jgi:hypothetical protein
MGQICSRDDDQVDLRAHALVLFNERIRNYRLEYHGPYLPYVEWCRAQYELDCIPKWCQQGPNYRPQYDAWGNQVY